MKKLFSSFIGSFFGGAFVLSAVFIPTACADPAQRETPPSEASIIVPQMVPESATQMRMSFAPVVKETAPAVVNVYSERKVRQQVDPFFSFFGRGIPRERTERSLGSGVIVRSNGVIVTNAHVIKGAQEMRVVLADRREFKATLLAADTESDLAILQIDTKGERLPVLPIASDNTLEVGDLVLAIGNPFGVGQTVTSGIVSALGRTQVSDLANFIQTDAAVNPGNSGGALVDMDGHLVGVNTAIFSRSGGSNGIGFAIPGELVKRAVDSALSEGKIIRPWIGARTEGVNAVMAEALGLDRPRGAIVEEIYAGGPADKAGIKRRDVVLSIDGTEIFDDSGLRFKLATFSPGHKARVQIWRDGKTRTVSVRADTPKENPKRDQLTLEGTNPFDGLSVVNMSPALAEEMDFDPYASGVVIAGRSRNGLSAKYRFRTGDMLLQIMGVDITSTEQLQDVLDEYDGERNWQIKLDRGGRVTNSRIRF
ncbi:MAG: serine protease [Robiginitomaculum sp.]|nr:MAG: serine protease [Robiginitomaculum sp.]PHQ68493.1 MAG: serine protease [Robiginitomaculum sp.]